MLLATSSCFCFSCSAFFSSALWQAVIIGSNMSKHSIIILFMMVVILLANIGFSFADEISSTRIDKGIVSNIVTEFKEETDKWYDKLKIVATDLFFVVILFEFVWTSAKAALQQMETKDYLINFTMIIVSGIFFLAVINNYQEWSQNVIFGLQKVAGSLTPTYTNEDNPFIIASKFYDLIEKRIDGLGILSSAGLIIGLLIAGFIITVCFSLITAKMIVIKCEVMVGMLASLLLIPLGASQMFREYAINAIRYGVSVGFKLFTMQLIISVGYGFMDKLAEEFNPSLYNIFIVIAFSLILLCLVFTLPDTIASLVSSAHGSSGNMLQALNTVANATTAAAAGAMAITSIPGKIAGGAVDTARGGKEVWDTFKGAKGKGVWDTSKNLGKEALALRDQAKLNNSSIGKELLNRHNARKIQPKK